MKNKKIGYKFEKQFLGRVIEQSPFSTQIFDTNGLCVFANQAWEELWRTSKESCIGKYNILQDEQVKEKGILTLVKKAFNGENVILPKISYISPEKEEKLIGKSVEELVGAKKTSRTYVSGRIFPVVDSQGKVENVVLIHEDATMQRRLELDLEDYSREIKTKTAEIERLNKYIAECELKLSAITKKKAK